MGYTMDTNGVIIMQSRTVNEKNATDFTPNDFLFHSKQRLRSPPFKQKRSISIPSFSRRWHFGCGETLYTTKNPECDVVFYTGVAIP